MVTLMRGTGSINTDMKQRCPGWALTGKGFPLRQASKNRSNIIEISCYGFRDNGFVRLVFARLSASLRHIVGTEWWYQFPLISISLWQHDAAPEPADLRNGSPILSTYVCSCLMELMAYMWSTTTKQAHTHTRMFCEGQGESLLISLGREKAVAGLATLDTSIITLKLFPRPSFQDYIFPQLFPL